MPLLEAMQAQSDEITAIRRAIHAQPELGFEEHLTSDLVAQRLTEWGIAIDRSLAKTAVVGIVHGRDGGASGRAIGLRADMTGFLDGNTEAFSGRPTYFLQMPDGSLLISDEQLGAIYRISYSR